MFISKISCAVSWAVICLLCWPRNVAKVLRNTFTSLPMLLPALGRAYGSWEEAFWGGRGVAHLYKIQDSLWQLWVSQMCASVGLEQIRVDPRGLLLFGNVSEATVPNLCWMHCRHAMMPAKLLQCNLGLCCINVFPLLYKHQVV